MNDRHGADGHVPDWIVAWNPQRSPTVRDALEHFRSADGRLTVCYQPGATPPVVGRQADRTVVVGGVIYGDQEVSAAHRLGPPLSTYGLYAAVVLDDAGALTAWRDHVGKSPLFWCAVDGTTYLSPSVQTLLHCAPVYPAPHRAMMAEHLLGRWLDNTETYFAHVKRVRHGCTLRFDGGGPPRETVYWNPDEKIDAHFDAARSDEILADFHALFETVIADMLTVGDPAIFLSGGLDSVSVAATASKLLAEQGRDPLLAMSIVFPPPVQSEESIQRSVAANLGLEQQVYRLEELLEGDGLLAATLANAATTPTPPLNPWSPVYRELGRRAAAAGKTTVLTGGGGDEWLGVGPIWAVDLLRRGQLVQAARLAMVYWRSLRLPLGAFTRNFLWAATLRPISRQLSLGLAQRVPGLWPRLCRAVMRRRARKQFSARPWVAPDRELRTELADRLEARIDAELRRSPFYMDSMFEAVHHPLMALDHDEIHHRGRQSGLLVLEPFWDPRLIEFLVQVPPAVLNMGGRTKGLVRLHLDQYFPALGFASQKKILAGGFYRRAISSQARAAWDQLGGLQRLDELGVTDAERARAALGELSSDDRLSNTVEALLILEAWARSNVAWWTTYVRAL